MSNSLRFGYFAHTFRSDWNNGNAHFLRGLARALQAMGHDVDLYEPDSEWSIDNLRKEPAGESSLMQFKRVYPELKLRTYSAHDSEEIWRERLLDRDVVILHEWNSPRLAQMLHGLREQLGYRFLFHDTHHRASSSPQQIQDMGLTKFDGVLVFGEALRAIYHDRLHIERVWTFHEAADTTVFHPMDTVEKTEDIVWIGNWGDGERSEEICEYLLQPAMKLRSIATAQVFGVRYPQKGIDALSHAGVRYGGYLPNLEAPAIYASARLTVHIPRQQYSAFMDGIPTIRVFEALACGIPLISAPWRDSENLFRSGDFCMVPSGEEMFAAMRRLLGSPRAAEDQARRGLETILSRHTCNHRALQLTEICEELLS
jgi:spore maturation protein CgeB